MSDVNYFFSHFWMLTFLKNVEFFVKFLFTNVCFFKWELGKCQFFLVK